LAASISSFSRSRPCAFGAVLPRGGKRRRIGVGPPAPAPFTRHSRPRPEFVLGVRQKTTPSEQRSMASRRERREWRSEFRGLGTRQVSDRERRSIWHNEEKAQEARRWLRTQERRPYLMGVAIGALATLVAAIAAALASFWFK
jgi:hypothetical protein